MELMEQPNEGGRYEGYGGVERVGCGKEKLIPDKCMQKRIKTK